MPVHSESEKPITNSSSAIERSSPASAVAGRRGRGGHFERAFGLAWPDCARAAASLSRIT